MNSKSIFKTLFFIITSAFFIISCEKSEPATNLYEDEGVENTFFSITGNSDSEIDTGSGGVKPLLHKRYDASLNENEAIALFRAEVSKFRKEHKETMKASYFYFDVYTRTSKHTHSETDGNVWARFNFLTDKGYLYLPWTPLNNEGDDRQNGAWDFYYFGADAPSISWLEPKSATLALQGTDGWHITYFHTWVWDSDQISSATGNSKVQANPGVWLDNNTASGWDFYYTGKIGTGRTTFN